VLFVLVFGAVATTAADYYQLPNIKRIEPDLYRSGKVVSVTSSCLHLTRGEEALLKYEGPGEYEIIRPGESIIIYGAGPVGLMAAMSARIQGASQIFVVMNSLVDAVKATGTLGVVGVFIPADPGAHDKLAQKGQIAFDFGKYWFKGQKMGTGQCNVKAYNRRLRDLIHHGKANPSMVISHELPLAEAPAAYKHFDNRDEGWTKVILHPNAA